MMKGSEKGGLADFEQLKYLDPENSTFIRTEGGFLSLHVEPDRNYPRVNLFRSFPFTAERTYISVREPEGEEVGIIRNLDDFPREVVALLDEEIDRRYFLPLIEKINSIKEEFGYSYWDVETNSGSRRFTIKRDQNSLIPVRGNRLLVIDVDGNRFEISDYKKLDAKSYRTIETLL
jgi:hypothetical protein